MENWHLLAAIIFIVILSIILITLWYTSSEFRKKVIDIKETGTDKFNRQLDLGRDFIDNLNRRAEEISSESETDIDINDVFIDPSKLGGLFEKCPCGNGLICDGGICKQRHGDPCVTSVACTNDSICYSGKCVPKPKTKNEIEKTKFNEGQICLNRHFLRLDRSKFNIESGWWNINEGLSICESNKSGTVYVVTENGIFEVSSGNTTTIKISNPDLIVSKMFRFLDKIHILTHNGSIYQLANESSLDEIYSFKNTHSNNSHGKTRSKKWKFRRVNQIYGKNIMNISVDDFYPCSDGSVSLRIEGKIYMYFVHSSNTKNNNEGNNGEEKKWILKKNALKIAYGNDSFHYSILYHDKVVVYHNDIKNTKEDRGVIFGKYKDILFGHNHSRLFILSRENSSVCEYYYNKPTLNKTKGKYRYRYLIGKGDYLFKTFDDIWLLTGSVCTSTELK